MDALMRRRNMILAAGGSAPDPVDPSDPWAAVFAAEADGTYRTQYSVGDTIALDLGYEGSLHMQIVAFDTDDLASGGGKAPITWISQELLTTLGRFNPYTMGVTTEGNGTIGGWEKSEARAYLRGTIKPLIPAAVRSRIVSVTKYTNGYDTAEQLVYDAPSADDVWLPSYRELFGGTVRETQGPIYSAVFASADDRKKWHETSHGYAPWWMRSAGAKSKARYIKSDGTDGSTNTGISYYFPLCFCT